MTAAIVGAFSVVFHVGIAHVRTRRFRIEVDHDSKAFCPRRSQHKCQSHRKQDTKSHHNNWDGIISGNLEHREAPKIADRAVWSPNWPKVDFASSRKRKTIPRLVKPTAKAKLFKIAQIENPWEMGECDDRRR